MESGGRIEIGDLVCHQNVCGFGLGVAEFRGVDAVEVGIREVDWRALMGA